MARLTIHPSDYNVSTHNNVKRINVVELTQEEYDNLTNYDDYTIYLIKE